MNCVGQRFILQGAFQKRLDAELSTHGLPLKSTLWLVYQCEIGFTICHSITFVGQHALYLRLILWRALQADGLSDEDEGSTGQSSALKAAGNIFIAVVGAGVLGLPYAFAKSGMVLGVSFLIFVAALALYAMLLLAQCKRCASQLTSAI